VELNGINTSVRRYDGRNSLRGAAGVLNWNGRNTAGTKISASNYQAAVLLFVVRSAFYRVSQ
jgi:hypothetical protein